MTRINSKKCALILLFFSALCVPIISEAQLERPSQALPINEFQPNGCGLQHGDPLLPEHGEISGEKTVLTNLIAYTQSIHNVIAKWDNGSAYSYSFGTTLGGDELCYGIALSPNARNTRGMSYVEMQNYALSHGVPFTLGDDFFLNIYDTPGNLDTAILLQFNWEDLGSPANELIIEIEMNHGLHGANAFTAVQAAKMMEFYDLVNPIIKQVYGPPSRNHTVMIVNDAYAVNSSSYYTSLNTVCTSFMLNADGDLDQPRLMVHELVHAYRDNVVLSSDSLWYLDPELAGFEEGMAEAVAQIVMNIFIETYPNFFNGTAHNFRWNQSKGMDFEWEYDFQNHSQITTENFWSSGGATGSEWIRYGIGATAMKKMYHEDPSIFIKFNEEYYNRLNDEHSLVNSRDLVVDIFNSIKPSVERTPITEWINKQHIFDCQNILGSKVFMLSIPRSSWFDFQYENRIYLLNTHANGLEWYWDSSDQLGTNEVTNGSGINWTWHHQYNNVVGEIKYRRDWDNTLYGSKGIATNAHYLIDVGGVYAGSPLLGPHQGPNPMYIGSTFTRNHPQDNCTTVPGCGKRAWNIGYQTLYTTTSNSMNMSPTLVSQGGFLLDCRAELDMHESGLYRFEVEFSDPTEPMVTDSYFKLLGDEFIDMKGIFGGIFSNNTDVVKGRMFIEHEDFGEESEIILYNNTFKSERDWAALLESDVNFQGGYPSMRYSVPGKTHAIYLGVECDERKIDFRTIGYGSYIYGNEMFLFNKDEMEDIVFTAHQDTAVDVGGDVHLSIGNNFEDIFDGDSRVMYTWKDAHDNFLTNDTEVLLNNVSLADSGMYTVEVEFFGCPSIEYMVHVKVHNSLNNNQYELDSDEISIMPNPTMNKLTVDFGSFVYTDMYIVNNMGQKMSCGSFKMEGKNVFDTSKLESGVYHVRIVGLNQSVSKKVIIQD